LRLLGAFMLAGAVSSIAACSAAPADEGADESEAEVSRARPPKLCAAVRGNGPYILVHFAGLARVVEHYGVVDGIAGGSSGSLSTFLYDSILENPAVSRCGSRRCSESERAARVSLALKSIEGYGMSVAGSDEG